MNNDFLSKLTGIIEEHISEEQFGVSELAGKAGMSRSNLLRKIKNLTGLSASQFIREVRLKTAMKMLREDSLNVSEVSYKVGFGSASYFIKCFREYYGYPPGEAGGHDRPEAAPIQTETVRTDSPPESRITGLALWAILIAAIAIVLLLFIKPFSAEENEPENSIAVLPFVNDSNDSTNVYFINGLMESILDNLQQIKGLRVISRTSVEKYRNNPKTIPEIARELNVRYVIEGSGQKIGELVSLHIQLIEAQRDKHLWSENFSREVKDIFQLQTEIAKGIADKIEVIITLEEEERISKPPTDDLLAYDYFLKGLDLFYQGTREGLEDAIAFYLKAIEQDPEFARAYAGVAIAYAVLDMYQVEKVYTGQINQYADKALLLDPVLPQSLIAKALYYRNGAEYSKAIPFLEKALEYNPNSVLVINILSDFYTNVLPDTEKYLEYALMGINLDIAAHDSAEASFIYLHVSNAFIQTGFTDEAAKYINKSLEYNPSNLYSAYVKAFILYARDRDLQQTKEMLIAALNKDVSRYDIIQETGKICYYMRDYRSAYTYYKKFLDIMEAQGLDVYPYENAKIGLVYDALGMENEAEELFRRYKTYADNDQSIYKDLSLAMYYAYRGEEEKAIEHLSLFALHESYHYWTILFLEIDPLVDSIKELPEFNKIMGELKGRFWENHNRIRASLEEKDLL